MSIQCWLIWSIGIVLNWKEMLNVAFGFKVKVSLHICWGLILGAVRNLLLLIGSWLIRILLWNLAHGVHALLESGGLGCEVVDAVFTHGHVVSIITLEWMLNLLPRLLLGCHQLLFSLVLFQRNVKNLLTLLFSWLSSFLLHHGCNLILRACHELVDLALPLMFNRIISSLLKASIVLVMQTCSLLNACVTCCSATRYLYSRLRCVWSCARSSYLFLLSLLLHFHILTMDILYFLFTILLVLWWADSEVKTVLFRPSLSWNVMRLRSLLDLYLLGVALPCSSISMLTVVSSIIIVIGFFFFSLVGVRSRSMICISRRRVSIFRCMWMPIILSSFMMRIRSSLVSIFWSHILGASSLCWFISLMMWNILQLWVISPWLVMTKLILTIVVLNEQIIIMGWSCYSSTVKFWSCLWLGRVLSLVLWVGCLCIGLMIVWSLGSGLGKTLFRLLSKLIINLVVHIDIGLHLSWVVDLWWSSLMMCLTWSWMCTVFSIIVWSSSCLRTVRMIILCVTWHEVVLWLSLLLRGSCLLMRWINSGMSLSNLLMINTRHYLLLIL